MPQPKAAVRQRLAAGPGAKTIVALGLARAPHPACRSERFGNVGRLRANKSAVASAADQWQSPDDLELGGSISRAGIGPPGRCRLAFALGNGGQRFKDPSPSAGTRRPQQGPGNTAAKAPGQRSSSCNWLSSRASRWLATGREDPDACSAVGPTLCIKSRTSQRPARWRCPLWAELGNGIPMGVITKTTR